MEKSTETRTPSESARITWRWAVTMTKVRIRRAVAKKQFPRWHFVTFLGKKGGESRGVVDMIAVRKHHGKPHAGLNLGDELKIILIQINGGSAARPTPNDVRRLRVVAKIHGDCKILLAEWKRGKEAKFFNIRPKARVGEEDWTPVTKDADLSAIFR
jgi:hypothetical protein